MHHEPDLWPGRGQSNREVRKMFTPESEVEGRQAVCELVYVAGLNTVEEQLWKKLQCHLKWDIEYGWLSLTETSKV